MNVRMKTGPGCLRQVTGPEGPGSALHDQVDGRPGERCANDPPKSVNEDLDVLALAGPDLGSIRDKSVNPKDVVPGPHIGHANRLRETGQGDIAHCGRSSREHGPAED